jgi:predicted lipoprotein with Yx(FWY)xxD motif
MTSLEKILLLVVISFSVTLTSCTKNAVNPLGSGENQITFAVTLSQSSSLGNYLVDKDGFTLYFFSDEFQGGSNCSGDCATLWPYFYAGTLTQANLGNGLLLSDFGTIQVNGVSQTTYKGWPLHYYAPSASDGYSGNSNVREAPGLTGGDGFNNIWFVAKPDYSLMVADGPLLGADGIYYNSDYIQGTSKSIYFTNDRGMTLYTYSQDHNNINNFTMSDFSNNAIWPVYETANLIIPSSIDKSKISTVSVFGHTQLTYNGWPLYFNGTDVAMGSNLGVSITAPGTWKVPGYNTPAAPL